MRGCSSPESGALGYSTPRSVPCKVEADLPFGSTSGRGFRSLAASRPHESMQAAVATRARTAAPTRRTDATALRDFHCFQPNGGAPPAHHMHSSLCVLYS